MRKKIYDNMVRSLFNKGDKEKYSHLVIAIDNDEMEYVKIFVKRDENIKDVLFKIICNPTYEIKEIYNYDMGLEEQIRENRTYHITTIYNRMNEAYKFAKVKHDGQTRADGSPYIEHPIRVAEIIKKYFSVHPRINELITAAYLHDTVEDTNTTIDEIRLKFGEYVAYLVNGVTNDKKIKQKMGKTDYLCYKILAMDEDVLNLKLCDRLANVLDLNSASVDFAEKYEIETIVIINYLLSNTIVTDTQREIIKDINTQINNLRKQKILKLVKNNN